MNEVARRLEEAIGTQFQRDMNGNPVVREYATVRNDQRVEGWYFRLDSPFDDLTNEQIDAAMATFPMVVDGVEYLFGNAASREWDEDRLWGASIAFYSK